MKILSNVTPKDLFKKLSLRNQRIELDLKVPDSFYQTLLEQVLERDYLNDTSDKVFMVQDKNFRPKRRIHWMQITRLPIHPNQNENYDLLFHWQGVLASIHAWGYRLIFLLLRHEGQTKLFLGTTSSQQENSSEEAVEQMREAAFGSMPGMGLRILDREEILDEVKTPLGMKDQVGAVTGIPSFRTPFLLNVSVIC